VATVDVIELEPDEEGIPPPPVSEPVTKAHKRRGPIRRTFKTIRDYLPRGNTLDDETFKRRHLLMCWVLGLHVPALFAYGVWQGYGVRHAAIEVVVPLACLALARLSINRRVAAFFVTAGLVFCSSALVHLSGGTIEAHFHFFILIGLIALYQDWVPFLWNVIFTVLSHGIGTVIAADIIFNHTAGQNRPWTWAAIHGVAVLAACIGVIIFWKNTEIEQQRNVGLVASMAAAQAEQRVAVSELLVNLARRNQSLLNRQLDVISDLELREQQPEALDDLFRLDHLATRIRRNAESLLVLSGDEPPRRWGSPVRLSEVARAAAAEVEDYRRVEVLVNDHLEVVGRAVADLAHLMAELIENATTFSPPMADVRVRSHLSPGEPRTFIVSIEDTGIGMPADEMAKANELLATAPEVDLRRSTMLGFHVVARLSKRYGIEVNLAPTPGGGLTALVNLPRELVGEHLPHEADVELAEPLAGVAARDQGQGDWPLSTLARHPEATGLAAERELVPALAPSSGWPEIRPSTPPVQTVSWADLEPTAPLFNAGTAWNDVVITPPPPPQLKPGAWWEESSHFQRYDDPGVGPAATPMPPIDRRIAPLVDRRTPSVEPPGSPAPAPPPAAPRPEPLAATPLSTGISPGAPTLARRVPGASLAPSLRRDAGDQPTHEPVQTRDPERVRSMLSRFQTNQRAGRAGHRPGEENGNPNHLADTHAPPPTDPHAISPQEDR
jgi:signal transduction histidine kinase